MFKEINVKPSNAKMLLKGKLDLQQKEVPTKSRSLLSRICEYCIIAIVVCITMGICTAMLQATTQLSSGWASLITTVLLGCFIAYKVQKK